MNVLVVFTKDSLVLICLHRLVGFCALCVFPGGPSLMEGNVISPVALGGWGGGGERGRGREIEGKGVAPELESKFQVTIDRNSVLHTVSIHRSQQGRPHSSPVQGKSNALDSLPTNPEAALATCAPGQVP